MKIGDIIKYDEYSEAVKWCNEKKAKLEEIEPIYEDVEIPESGFYDEEGNYIILEEKHTEKKEIRRFQIVAIPKPSLDELKEAKREEINKARDKAEQAGFEYMGKVFDSDQVSCIRMMGASQALSNAPAETTITWTCQDNSTINLNGTEFAGLVVALATHSNTCHQKATELKAQIEKATSAEELEGIKWNQA